MTVWEEEEDDFTEEEDESYIKEEFAEDYEAAMLTIIRGSLDNGEVDFAMGVRVAVLVALGELKFPEEWDEVEKMLPLGE